MKPTTLDLPPREPSPSPNPHLTIVGVKNREVRLISRPKGMPVAGDFSLVENTPEPLKEDQVLVRNIYMSVDPYMRGRMNEGPSYLPAFELGKVLAGAAVGEVVESRNRSFQRGDVVTSQLGWREYAVASGKELRQVSRDIQPLSTYLGALGMPGMTAWAGLRLGGIKATDVVFISGAAGAVGSVAGQLAKQKGCRVIGSAGTKEKIQFLLEDCGFDVAFNYKDGPIDKLLAAAAPEGIDLYFDNVGGPTLDAALTRMKIHGRIVACGGISGYNQTTLPAGPSHWFNIITQRLVVKGLLVRDWIGQQAEFEIEVGRLIQSGELRIKETTVRGIENAADAFLGLFEGRNVGKMVVELSPSRSFEI